ncbi:MAG: oligosaccharide flippase family protein, partial [Anaerolineae bacterium]|nr:oligosaccharide flippase family protein [Anaerolineae bacterium]
FGITTGISTFAANLLVHVDNFILGTIAGTTALGYYDRAYRIALWPSLLLNAVVGRAAVFTYSQLQGDIQRLQRSATMMLWLSFNVAIPVTLMLFISAPDLVRLLFGEQWLPSVPLLRILLVASLVRPLWENSWSVFIGTGTPRRALELALLQLVVLAVAATVLTYALSATGTAIAAVLAFSVGLLAARYMLKNRLPLDWRDILSGPLMAMGLTLAGYVLLVRLIGNLEPLWISVAWKVVWALLGFALFSLLVQPKQFMQRISYAWRLVRGRPQAA